jgi:release factor glutamine methyltransferase
VAWKASGVSLELFVDECVLRPRRFSEALGRQVAREGLARSAERVADLGTGVGVVALTIAAEAPELEVWATELRPEALELARRNARANGLAVSFALGDWFDALPADLRGRLDLAVATPPYLTPEEYAAEPPSVRNHTPYLAMVGGPTGLEPAAAIAAQARIWLRPGGALYLEAHPGMFDATAELLADAGFEVEANRWMSLVIARRPGSAS